MGWELIRFSRVPVRRCELRMAVALGLSIMAGVGGGLMADDRPAAQIPAARTEYLGRQIAPFMSYHGGASWLLRRMREREEGTSTLIPELRVKPGMTVCDLGSGNGYHSLMLAPLVAPGGRVLAVDIQQEMLDDLKARAARAGVTNIETILGEVHDPKLTPGSCDLILMVDVYHEFSHPEPMLVAIRRALKPSGLVALVEFRGEDHEVPIKPEHKMTKAQVLKEWKPNGFELAREFDELPWQHLMFFRRGPDPAPPGGGSSPATAPSKSQ